MSMKISIQKIFSFLALSFMVGLISFAGYWDVKFSGTFLCELFAASVVFAFLSNMSGLKYTRKVFFPKDLAVWLLFVLFVLASYKSNMLGSTRILMGILFCVCLRNNTKWLKQGLYLIGVLSGVSVFFTYFFLAFPGLYSFVINAYGFTPSGTSHGAAGYRAGISDHYSQNGIYVSIFFLVIIALLLAIALCKAEIKHKKALIIIAALGLGSILLTGKRGVLVFSLIAVVVVYLFASNRKLDRTIKLVVAFLIAIGTLQILSEVIPAIGYVFQRFQVIGEDGSSAERLAMWNLALRKFLSNPITGNGFWSFRRFYNQELGSIFHPYQEQFQTLNAHNVYLQVLCETGICGFLLYIAAVLLSLRKTLLLVRNLNALDCTEEKVAVLFSLSMQMFYITYSFSGNCLYDIVFPFYAIAMAMELSIWSKYDFGRGIKKHESWNLNISQSK